MILIFGLILTLIAYEIGVKAKETSFFKKVPPIVMAGIIIVLFLRVFNIKYSTYSQGASLLTFLLGPATISLAFPLVSNIEILKKHKRAIWGGLFCATFVVLLSTFAIGEILHVHFNVILSLLPKSVTAPIAVQISKAIGGIPELTACVVVLTGVVGAMAGHRLLRLCHIKNDVAIGLSIGATCHVLGTARCIEKNKNNQAAISTFALIAVGVLTAVVVPFLIHFFR